MVLYWGSHSSASLQELTCKKYEILFSKDFYNLIKSNHVQLNFSTLEEYNTFSDNQWEKVSLYTILPINVIRQYKDKVDWNSVSYVQDLTNDFVDEVSEYIDFNNLSKNWNYVPSEEILQKYINKTWNWDFLSVNSNVPDSTIIMFKDKINWPLLSSARNISYELVYQAKEYIDWSIFYCSNLQVNHEQLFIYQDLSFRMRLIFVEGLLDYFRTRREHKPEVNINIQYTDLQTYDDKCPICRDSSNEESSEEGTGFIKIKCNHIFHKQCIFQWIQKSQSCPMCRIQL